MGCRTGPMCHGGTCNDKECMIFSDRWFNDIITQLRKLYDELKDYTPPLDLLRRLSPDAPALARRLRNSKQSWWNKTLSMAKSEGSSGQTEATTLLEDRERALVRVLSGEEELAELNVPKASQLLAALF